MKHLFLTITLISTAALSCARAQESTRKTVKPAQTRKSVAPEPAASKMVPVQVPFQPVLWLKDAPASAYMPNEAVKVHDWVIAQIAAVPGKPDQFSTTEERRAYEGEVVNKLKSIGPLAVVHQCSKKYNGDQQKFEIEVSGSSINDEMLKDPNPELLRLRKVLIGRGEVIKDTYTGQNAYGAATEISRNVSEMFALAFSHDLNLDPSSVWIAASTGLSGPTPYRLNYGAYTFNLPMPPAEARVEEKNISCLFVFTVSPPGAFKFTHRILPTRDTPFDFTANYRALMGTFDMLAVINTVSGQVYAKATREGFAGQ